MGYLSSNQVFATSKDGDECIRILAIMPGGAALYFIDLSDESAMPVQMEVAEFEALVDTGEMIPLGDEPVMVRAPTDSHLTESAIKVRDKRWERIRGLVEENRLSILDPPLRHRLLMQLETEKKHNRSHLYEALRLYWRRGQLLNALAPNFHKCGAPGRERPPGEKKRGRPRLIAGTTRGQGVNVTPEMAAKLMLGIGFLKSGLSWTKAFKEVALKQFPSPELVDGIRVAIPADQRPTLAQFKYHVGKKLSPADIERATRGEAAYERNKAHRTGFSKDVPFGPGDIFQIDATIANLYLRSRVDPDVLVGRPVLYVVTDQSSGLIVGFAVSLGNASWEVAKLALENAFTDKVNSCRAIDVEIREADWPSRHIPTQLTGDRGWEILGKNAGTGGHGLGFVVANLPPYRPDLKGLVEGKFQLLDIDAFKHVVGATHGRDRGDRDDRPNKLDGVYDLDAFREFMVRAIIRHNNAQRIAKPPTWYPVQALGSPTHVQVWEYGCKHRGGPITRPPWQVRAHLLPEVSGKLTNLGLKVGRLMYAPIGEEERAVFDRLAGRNWGTKQVKQDPRDVSAVLVPAEDGDFQAWPLVPADRRFKGWSLAEVTESFARRRALDSISEDDGMYREAEFSAAKANLDKRVRNDARRKRAELGRGTPATKRVNLSADKQERALESRERSSEEAWSKVAGPAAQPPPSSIRATRRPIHHTAAPEQAAARATAKPRRTSKLSILDEIDQEQTGRDER